MSLTRTSALVGLAGLGLWLLTTGPVQAGQSSFTAAIQAAATAPVEAAQMPMGTGKVTENCSFNGIKLAGKVKVVDSFPDVRIKAVTSFPDLKVKKVTSFADDCGEWQFVDSFADFKVQYVDSFPDIEIAWVDGFAGVPG